ncbi:hypothetical protein ACQ3G6_01045 [Allorhizobium undicola]|uniref:hypothetical protein n=1 Tax=Allorhizobium undicola TaxID=78527 RepID=UPI000485A80A|nr:hypothetical protein [Allorhizobium undicola]
MFRILFFAGLILIAWWYIRRFTANAERLLRRRRQQEKEHQTGAIATLVKDPRTGEYRLMRDDE